MRDDSPIKFHNKMMLSSDVTYQLILNTILRHSDFDYLNSQSLGVVGDKLAKSKYNRLEEYLTGKVSGGYTGLQILLSKYSDKLNKLSSFSDQIQLLMNVMCFFVMFNLLIENASRVHFNYGLSLLSDGSFVSVFSQTDDINLALHLYTKSSNYDLIVMTKLSDPLNDTCSDFAMFLIDRKAMTAKTPSYSYVKMSHVVQKINMYDITNDTIEELYDKYLDAYI